MAVSELKAADKKTPSTKLLITRVANGWVIHPDYGTDQYTHVEKTPEDLAAHVLLWAQAQLI